MINLALADDETLRLPRTSRETVLTILDALESLLLRIRTDQYAAQPGGRAVGQQVARCLARVDSLVRGTGTGTIAYAPPSQDLAVDPIGALKAIRALRVVAAGWPRAPLSSVVRTIHSTAAADEPEIAWSTLDAEAAFVIGEAVDAQRTIAEALRRAGAEVPDGFGEVALPPLTARRSAPPVWALWQRLDDIAALLLTLPPGVYTARVDGNVSGTLGAHVRHCLDHVSALLSAEPSATLSYDGRRRGTAIEADSAAALQQILRLKAALERSSTRSLDEPVRVASQIDRSGASIVGWSTFGRELAFVLSHTIHHQATMAAVLALHGVDVPGGFGYAPSTPRH